MTPFLLGMAGMAGLFCGYPAVAEARRLYPSSTHEIASARFRMNRAPSFTKNGRMRTSDYPRRAGVSSRDSTSVMAPKSAFNSR
jgi:hypothetical protein